MQQPAKKIAVPRELQPWYQEVDYPDALAAAQLRKTNADRKGNARTLSKLTPGEMQQYWNATLGLKASPENGGGAPKAPPAPKAPAPSRHKRLRLAGPFMSVSVRTQ